MESVSVVLTTPPMVEIPIVSDAVSVPVEPVVVSPLPVAYVNGAVTRVDLRKATEKGPEFPMYVYNISTPIVRPNDKLVLPDTTSFVIHIAGSPGSGKSTCMREIQQYIKDRQKGIDDPVPVVTVDTDELFDLFFSSVAPNLTAEEFKDQWFQQLHPTLLKFFAQQPKGALILCFGVCDAVFTELSSLPFSVVPKAIHYLIPFVDWNQKYFLDVGEQKLIHNLYEREVVKCVNDPELRKKLTDIDSDDKVEFFPRKIRINAQVDRNIYVNELGYIPNDASTLVSYLKGVIDTWSPPKSRKRKR